MAAKKRGLGRGLDALLGGDGDVISEIFRQRVTMRGKGVEMVGWQTAYGRPERAP